MTKNNFGGLDMEHQEKDGMNFDFAVQTIKKLRQIQCEPVPKNYELMFTYVSGRNRELSQRIDELITEKGTVTPEDAEALYEFFFSQHSLIEQASGISSDISNRLEQVLSQVSSALSSASSYEMDLAGAEKQLNQSNSQSEVLKVVGNLIQTTSQMRKQNLELEQQLKNSQVEISKLNTNLEEVRNESLTDDLTGLFNRKAFDAAMAKCIAHAENSGQPFCLLVLDIDFFKKFNDNYGHQVGDQVLRLLGSVIKSQVKGRDMPARYGGEEFVIILSGIALSNAHQLAEQIRHAVSTKGLVKKSTGAVLGRITVSIGVSQWRKHDTAKTMIERGDQALYQAKRNGRNQVVCESELENKVADMQSVGS